MADLITRRSTLAPASIDAEARTAEVVWSTGAGVRRRDLSGPYEERLSLPPDAVDLSRLIGASVLDAHRQDAVRDVLGPVRGASVDGNPGRGSGAVLGPAPRWSPSGRTL
uniref:Peptidase U35, phage prohead HK97 n=1 Tax=Magnetospirillum gryphiswaldense TaxID=55518 RepID=A4TTU0_9PROT|nr:peptidase U35, phage prohead HK97 [Magnetospirillum gryphiswaldense MSR-1]